MGKRGASPSGRAKTSAAAKKRNRQNLPSHSPSTTGSSDPGTSQVDPRLRTRSVESSPAGEKNATERGKGEWGRPQVRMEDGPPQRVAMGMPPQRVPAAWKTEGGDGRKTEPRERVC